MKEFTKSLFSYSLAMTMFSFKQIDNLLSAPDVGAKLPAIRSMDSVTTAILREFGETFTDTFQAADNFQRGVVEAMFSVLFPFAPSRMKPDIPAVYVVAEPQRWTEAMDPLTPPLAYDPGPDGTTRRI